MFSFIFILLTAVSGFDLISAYHRTLFHAKEVSTPSNNLAALLDPNLVRMVNYDGGSVYTQADANQLTQEAKTHFFNQFGLNYFTAPFNSTFGGWMLPAGFMFPFTNGDNFLYRLIFDDKHIGVGILNDRFVLDVGYLVLMNVAGNFTGGVMSGTSFNAGDILFYTQYTYLKESQRGKPHHKKDIEIIKILSEQPAFQYRNSQGLMEQYIKAKIIDEDGRIGYAGIMTTVTLENGAPYQRIRSILTFNSTSS